MMMRNGSLFSFLVWVVGFYTVGWGAPVKLVEQAPRHWTEVEPGVVLIDFERVAFGNVRLMVPDGGEREMAVHFGEALVNGRIDRKPSGSVRYGVVRMKFDGGRAVTVFPPADARNTKAPPAVLTPPEWGVVLPFRWVEIEGWPGGIEPGRILRQAAFSSTWDDGAAAFKCSDDLLNRLWELCRYSIKATTFAGVYVDGDRERIAYEIDAHLAQLSHYATEGDVQMARDTFDWLMRYPTWPTECALHMVLMAHADWRHTGDLGWLAPRYESLKTKLLLERSREDGLLVSTERQVRRHDVVDWPPGERDGFEFRPVNTVVNAFHLRALALMAELAGALDKPAEAAEYAARVERARTAFQEVLFDPGRGLYRDGQGSEHFSQHASLFPLAFGLVPEERRAGVVRWLAGRGMACSVYAAQYLLEALFLHGAAEEALRLMTAPGDRSWRHMVESGTTITWEAWDQKYKPNQDWNHAWGAAPANLLPRFVLGVRPLEAGWKQAVVRPHTGRLTSAEGKVPTPRGPVEVRWERGERGERGERFTISLGLPEGMSGRMELPAGPASTGVFDGDRAVPVRRQGDYWILDEEVTGKITLQVR